MLFRHLILPGGDTRINLSSNSLIHRFITDGVASTNAINDKSIQICPSLYLDEDALCTKVNQPKTVLPFYRHRPRPFASWPTPTGRSSIWLPLSSSCGQWRVAKVQSQVVEAVSRIQHNSHRCDPDIFACLNSDLLDVTQFYKTLCMWECKPNAIFHCNGQYDAALVTNVSASSTWKWIYWANMRTLNPSRRR